MSSTFEPHQGLIIVPVEVWGPTGSAVLRLALDTGATITVLSVAMLVALGYDGLIGLGFFRDRNLAIDFRAGQITVV